MYVLFEGLLNMDRFIILLTLIHPYKFILTQAGKKLIIILVPLFIFSSVAEVIPTRTTITTVYIQSPTS
jgi:hypothetical protein